jgi:hypothetical protein
MIQLVMYVNIVPMSKNIINGHMVCLVQYILRTANMEIMICPATHSMHTMATPQ